MLAFTIPLLLLFTVSERISPPPPGAAGGSNHGHKAGPAEITVVKNEPRVSEAGDRNFCAAASTLWMVTEKNNLALKFLVSKSNFFLFLFLFFL